MPTDALTSSVISSALLRACVCVCFNLKPSRCSCAVSLLLLRPWAACLVLCVITPACEPSSLANCHSACVRVWEL